MAMTAEEYHQKYGYERDMPGWDEMSDTDKGLIKNQYPFYQDPGQQEQGMTQDWWNQYQAGPDINIWRGLSEVFGFKPGAIKQFAVGKLRELMTRPDFAKEYGLGKKALTQQLMEAERGLAGKFAARGLLDSSAHAQAVGGAMGGYTQGLANLMLGKAGMEQTAYENQMNIAGNYATQGLNFADFLNTQYLQEMGLGAEAINYMQQNRAQENAFNMQRYGINPNPNNPITGLEAGLGIGNTLASMYAAGAGGGGYNFDWGGSGGGGGGGQTPEWYENPMSLFGD